MLAKVSYGTADDIDKAVKAARDAFDGPWRNVDATNRGNLLLKLADLVEADLETIATLECLDSGKTFAKSIIDITEVYEVFRYYGGFADKFYGETIDSGKHRFTYTLREPLGVCGGITP